ncbi:MAG: diguanylate cyclase, partial [Dolichospermum sp.]|nr:diguanylate cyclase [Dolichospermum sp.]
AEGVETESELAFLRENKCDAIQGFICSPALPALEFQKLLLTNKSLSI